MAKKTKPVKNKESASRSSKAERTAKSTSSKKKGARKASAIGRKPMPAHAAARPVIDPTDEEISLRAYFISERRHRLALPGDASSDWIEARRQLLSELGLS